MWTQSSTLESSKEGYRRPSKKNDLVSYKAKMYLPFHSFPNFFFRKVINTNQGTNTQSHASVEKMENFSRVQKSKLRKQKELWPAPARKKSPPAGNGTGKMSPICSKRSRFRKSCLGELWIESKRKTWLKRRCKRENEIGFKFFNYYYMRKSFRISFIW